MKVWSLRWTALALLGMPVGSAAVSPNAPPAQKHLASFDARIQPLLERMTLDEKVGQMTQAEAGAAFVGHESDVETLSLGSLLSGGNADPRTNSLADWTDMYDTLQARTRQARLKIPFLYGVDAVHGHTNVIGAVAFPHNIGLGATRNPALVEEIARLTALEVRASGIQWTFAPCVTVPRDERWGRTYEGYAEEPSLVAELGAAAVRGLQGQDLSDPRRVLACAKHFVGDGGTVWSTGQYGGATRRAPLDQGDTRVDEATLRRIHLPGYVTSIAAGVGSIMPSYSSWNGEKCSGSKRLLTEILKDELGFEGFLISDYNALDALPGDTRAQIRLSINAGMDMVMVPNKYRQFVATLKSLAEAGEVPMARIDDAVRRILRVKFAMGLMDEARSPLADRALWERFGSAAHRAVARQAVRESLVLLKNEKRTLPLSRGVKRVHVAGRNADDLGHQSGGWTVDWQGLSGSPTLGTTVLGGIRELAKTVNVTYSKDGTGAQGADVGVVVVGEAPYAEGLGDRADLSLSAEDLAAIANVKQAGIPVVVVVISGRPMILGDALAQADALVAAWLPGSEGQGVADVLFGDYKPTGKLSFTWPRSMQQIPINVGDKDYDPLFPFGFGLTY